MQRAPKSGLVHTVKVTAANEHDVTVTSELLTGEEEEVYGDSGYLGAEKRPEALKKNKAGKSVHYKINCRPSQSRACFCCSQAAASFPKDMIPRAAKTNCKNEYYVCFGKLDFS